MGQINQYSNKAAYTNDQKRLKNISAVSHIIDSGAIIADGVNILVEKETSKPGDLVVFDTREKDFKFVVAETLNKAELAKMAHLNPFGVVYAIDGDMRKIVSLDQYSERWAHSFEALLTGFNTSADGSATITVKTGSETAETMTISWTAGESLESIANKIKPASKALKTEALQQYTASISPDGMGIILSHNWYSGATVTEVTGCVLSSQDDINYQSKYALINKVTYVRRNNGYNSYFAGANLAEFCEYYGTNGKTPSSPIQLGSSDVMNRTAFESSEHCVALRERYGSYEEYLAGEHMAEYPSRYGAFADDGLRNTLALVAIKGTTVRGPEEPAYPAATRAAAYKVPVSAGQEIADQVQWHLPSSSEMEELIRDRRYYSSDDSEDLVNDTLAIMGGSSIYGHAWVAWTSSECYSSNAFFYYGWYGTVRNYSKFYSYSVRPVSAL